MIELPSVDISFIVSLIENHPKIRKASVVGDTRSYLLAGKIIAHRLIVIRDIDGQIDFNLATSIVTKLNCIGELLTWFEKNRSWKDGGYFIPAPTLN